MINTVVLILPDDTIDTAWQDDEVSFMGYFFKSKDQTILKMRYDTSNVVFEISLAT